MSNFRARTITGLSMVFILLAALYFSGWVFYLVFFPVVLLGLNEFYGLIPKETASPQRWFGIFAGAAIYITTVASLNIPGDFFTQLWLRFIPFILPIPLIFLTFILEIYRKKEKPILNIAVTLLGIFYVAVPLSLLLPFAGPDALRFLGMPEILVGYFGFTWIYDTGAYLYGKQFGRRRFFERISPKKTWEGTIAGALLTLILAVVLGIFIPDLQFFDWIILALIVILFGSWGDLAESLFKRSLGIKDSGDILPGHGGILDRFDTMLISAPFVFLYFFIRNLI